MLTPAWYLTDGDHIGELPKVAQMHTRRVHDRGHRNRHLPRRRAMPVIAPDGMNRIVHLP